jgi:hypothetical protein
MLNTKFHHKPLSTFVNGWADTTLQLCVGLHVIQFVHSADNMNDFILYLERKLYKEDHRTWGKCSDNLKRTGAMEHGRDLRKTSESEENL